MKTNYQQQIRRSRFNSTHEGYAVILEEAQETEDEMRKNGMNLNACGEVTWMNQSPADQRVARKP